MCMPSPTQPTEDQQDRSRKASTLRRHKTLPGPLRSFPTNGSSSSSSRRFQPDGRTNNFTMLLRLSKSNPYVGWFRHAPPMISLQNLTAEASEWLQQYHLQKNDTTTIRADVITPLLLQLRRCTSSITCHKVPTCQRRLLSLSSNGGILVEPTVVAVYRALKLHHLRQPDLAAGMLLGGTTVEDLGATTTKNTNIIATVNTTSSNVLSNIACWLLDVSLLTENPPSLQELGIVPTINEKKKKCSSSGSSSCCKSDTADSADSSLLSSQDDEDDDDDDELTMESRDEQEQQSPHSTTTTRPPMADDDGRLDYNITQMDIVRMNRIASRHLDVESIFNLPTVTYQPPGSHPSTNDTTTNAPKDDDNSFSWMLVHSDSEASEADGCGEAQHHHRRRRDSADGCVICLEEFTAGDRLRILPCQHKFHISCIDRWLSGVHSDDFCITSGCPTCKTVPTSTTTLTMNSNLNESSVVPGWAFARIGDALIRESQHFG